MLLVYKIYIILCIHNKSRMAVFFWGEDTRWHCCAAAFAVSNQVLEPQYFPATTVTWNDLKIEFSSSQKTRQGCLGGCLGGFVVDYRLQGWFGSWCLFEFSFFLVMLAKKIEKTAFESKVSMKYSTNGIHVSEHTGAMEIHNRKLTQHSKMMVGIFCCSF